MAKATISHKGMVSSVTNNLVQVNITSMSACSSCHAKGACNASDMQEKIIDALPGTKQLNVGDMVTIIGKESMGFKALFLGYLIPFLLVLVALIIGTITLKSETTAGLISLAVLAPYYLVLYFNRNKVKKSFIFEIQ